MRARAHTPWRDPAAGPTDLVGRLLAVPAGDVPDVIADEARALGRCGAALYVLDLDGAVLRRLAGGAPWPSELPVGEGAVGPELPLHAVPRVEQALRGAARSVVVRALAHGHAAHAFLAWERAPLGPVDALAEAAATALAAADRRSDVVARARRARPTSPSAEVQENLLPPRLATLAGGAELAAAIAPAYDFGGDWFDYAENPDGVWLAVADAAGGGVPAAAPSLLALGALRAARRSGASLAGAARLVDATLKELDDPGRFVTAILARWDPASRELRWLRFGHPPALRVRPDGSADLVGEDGGEVPLGLLDPERALTPQALRLAPGDRLVLTSDGVWERQVAPGARLALGGVRAALRRVSGADAASTVSGMLAFVREVGPAPLDDDATVLCLAVP